MKSHEIWEQIQKISPEFEKGTKDLWEVLEKADPLVVAALLYKVAEERRKANIELEKIGEKFDKIMLELKTRNSSQADGGNERQFSVLPENDQKILKLAEKKPLSARDVQEEFGYKNPNAASQRLNSLCRQGFLKKVQSGKKVVFLA